MCVYFKIIDKVEILAVYRSYGWIRLQVEFVYPFLQGRYLLLGLMIGDTGITFQLRKQGELFF